MSDSYYLLFILFNLYLSLLCLFIFFFYLLLFDLFFVFFFFQAEDGIRDTSVTGVQTCALPISSSAQGPEPYSTTIRLRLLETACALGAIFAAAKSACGNTESPGDSVASSRRTIARPESTWPDCAKRSASMRRASV